MLNQIGIAALIGATTAILSFLGDWFLALMPDQAMEPSVSVPLVGVLSFAAVASGSIIRQWIVTHIPEKRAHHTVVGLALAALIAFAILGWRYFETYHAHVERYELADGLVAHVVVGDELTRFGQSVRDDLMKELGHVPTMRLIETTGGVAKVNRVWTEASIKRIERSLAVSYLVAIMILVLGVTLVVKNDNGR